MASDSSSMAGPPRPERYRFGDIVVDADAHTLERDGQPQALEPKAFAVLLELLRRAGSLVNREQLLDVVWGHRHVTPGVLTRAIAQLRTALDDDPHHPRYIQTQHALGYRFIGRIEVDATPAAPQSATVDEVRSDQAPGLAATASEAIGADAPVALQSEPAAPPPTAPAADRRRERIERRQDEQARQRRAWYLAALLGILLAWFTWQRQATPPPVPREASIAVLPFTTLSDDRDDRYFAEGLAAEMLGALAGVQGLTVAAWLPAEAIDRQLDMPALGRKLGVATVLDASVRRQGSRVRIVAHLSDTTTGYTLWTQTYDRDASAVFDTQTEIAREVAQALVGVLPDAGESLRRRLTPTRNLAAFDAYLRGLQQLINPARDDGEAISQFQKALALDTGFARAQAGICRAEIWRFEAQRNVDAFENARLACLRAANMDPTIGVVQMALGDLYRATGKPEQALEHYDRAAADLSVRPLALAGRGQVLAGSGRHDEAIAAFQEALMLAPRDADVHASLGFQLYLADRMPEAIDALRRASELRPGDAYVWSTYGSMLMSVGRNEEARIAFGRSLEIEPIEAVLANLGTLDYQARNFAGAVALYRQAIELNPGNGQLWGLLADSLMADPATASQAPEAFGKAIELTQPFVDLKSDDAVALATLGWYRANLGEAAAARDLARRAEALGSAQSEVALYNAETYAILGDLDEARRQIDLARAAGAPDIRIHSSTGLQRVGLVPTDSAAGRTKAGNPRADGAQP
jgi:TolB-like protein/DNA-binding winged helix-turn-helix (wHTH) protein/Flp pilus assembly protein TadD